MCKIWKRGYNLKNKKDFEVIDRLNFINICIVILNKRKLLVIMWFFNLYLCKN